MTYRHCYQVEFTSPVERDYADDLMAELNVVYGGDMADLMVIRVGVGELPHEVSGD